jgi:two-component system phosphate regulon sensor histidine kinase PhoR
MPSVSSIWPLSLFVAAAILVVLQYWWEERRRSAMRAEANRQYTEATLKQQRDLHAQFQARQQTLFDSMIEGVLLLDTQGRVLMVNNSLRALLDFSADIRGKTIAQAFEARSLASLAERLAVEKTLSEVELELGTNPPRHARVNAAVVLDGEREQGAIFVFHDVTRLKQLENMRREFVANVSHELRTPLSLIHGYSETLLDGAKNDPELSARFIQKIDKQSQRLLFLIEDLLNISRLESGRVALNLQTVDLREMARRSLDDLAPQAAAVRASLINDIPASTLVTADGARLHQVFFNLVENAIKYGKPGGVVRVSSRLLESGRIEVSVVDDGPGIPTEAIGRIFERFFRVDRARSRETGGTGLGLSIVKHIVQAHGGEVRVESRPPGGASFFFTLPASGPDGV